MTEPGPGTLRPARRSTHVAPDGLYETTQHYVGDLVYGANDGILTTFAVVAGVTGGALSATTVIVVGIANLVADGLSMGVGNYLGIRARESALERQGRPQEEAQPARHGLATFLAFVVPDRCRSSRTWFPAPATSSSRPPASRSARCSAWAPPARW